MLAAAYLVSTPAAAQDDTPSEVLGRWSSAANEGAQAFGKSGDYLGVVTAKAMVETTGGSGKRAAARGWNTTLSNWRGTTEATKKSLPYSVAPALFGISDVVTSVVAPAVEGDGKGAVSGAVNIGVSTLVVTQGSAAGAQLFGAIGGAVGSFIPVVGTAAGVMVGGAIGSVTGGFVASIAYDRYGKSIVANLIEGGLSAITDPTPLQQAIAAREAFLRKQAAPELQAQWNYGVGVSEGFGQEETQLYKPLTGVYQPKIKGQPAPARPPPPPAGGQLAALQNATQLQLTTWGKSAPEYKVPHLCRITGTAVRCTGSFKVGGVGGFSEATFVMQGSLQGNTIAGNTAIVVHSVISNGSPCKSFTYEYTHHETTRLAEDGSLMMEVSPSVGRLTQNDCSPLLKSTQQSPGETSAGTWRVLQ